MTRNLLPHFLFLALWLVGGAYLFDDNCAFCSDPVTTTNTTVPAKEIKKVKNESKIVSDNLQELFYKSSNFQLSPSLKKDLDKFVTAFAEKNADHYIQLEGSYLKRESNVSQYPDLGLARAIMAKNYLGTKGVDLSKFSITSKAHSGDPAEGNLSISTFKEAPISLDFKEVVNVPIDLYFESEDLKLSPDQKEKLFKISRYLDQRKIGLVKVDGHTDDRLIALPDTKEWSDHMKMANQQAMFVTNLLIENGIPEDRISTNAYSPDLEKKRIKEALAKKKRVTLTLKGKK